MAKDFVILGAGSIGLMTAIACAKNNIRTLVLEKSDMNYAVSQRNIALTERSKLFMEKCGIWDHLRNYISPMKDIYVIDNKSSQMLHLSHSDADIDSLGYMIEHHHIFSVIKKIAESNQLITLKTNTEYDVILRDQECEIDIGDQVISADLAIICEGKNSALKKIYFKNMLEKHYTQSAITISVQHEKPHEYTAVEHFMPRGVFAILPLPNQYQSSIVWAEPHHLAKIYIDMEKEELNAHIQDRFGEFLGDVQTITTPQIFPLSAHLVQNYYHGRLAVAGDAAHSIHPLSGQGLNQGIKDIDTLVNLMHRNSSIGLGIDKTLLREYESQRKLDNYKMYLLTDNLNRFFCNDVPVLKHARRIGLQIIDNAQYIKRLLIKNATYGGNNI